MVYFCMRHPCLAALIIAGVIFDVAIVGGLVNNISTGKSIFNRKLKFGFYMADDDSGK